MTAVIGKIISKSVRIHTFAEYLAKEERALQKNEFYNGQIIAMAGAKYNHNLISSNIIHNLNTEIQGLKTNYVVLNSDQRVYIEAENTALYPDALVICEAPQFWNGREDLLTNPIIVVEVLSRSTRKYDLTDKFLLYQLLPSFREYITIEPYKAQVRTWSLEAPKLWKMNTISDLTQFVEVNSIGIQLKMSDIYRNVIFKK